MKKRYYLAVMLAFGLVYFFSDLELPEITTDEIEVNGYVTDTGNIEVYFCPHQDCETALVNFIDTATVSLDCALFDIGLESVQNKLLEKSAEIDVRIVTDNDYLKKFNHSFVKTDTWGLQHNKFCIVDGKKLSTGSMNPTDNGAHKNNNNLLLIDSKVLAANYQAEFDEMWNGVFKKGDNVLNPKIILDEIYIGNYFCPEDSCADKVKEELKKATESINFMTFSFTHEGIANILLLKKLENITIKGVFEARQVSQYSKYELLKYQDVDVIKDSNKNNMHHKVWIIDNKTVITGSFNPSAGGDTRNDENILIIRDSEIAQLFLEEFKIVYG